MTNFTALLRGELQRLIKYGIIGASLVVAMVWLTALHFTDIADLTAMFSLVLFIDAVSMSILLIGVTIFFEKGEGSLKSLLISPVTHLEHILAKTSGNITSNVLTLVVLYSWAWYFREIQLGFAALLGAVILVALFHSLVGFLLTFYSKTFTDLLINMMKYVFVLMIPVLFDQIGLIQNELISTLLYAIPTKASMTVLTASAGGLQTWEIWFSVVYLLVGSGILLRVVLNRFEEFAVRESGV